MKKPLSVADVFEILGRLEVHQYPHEPRPVGGYGAGLAVLEDDRSVLLEKVGKASSASPAKELSGISKSTQASVLIAHVRMPSPRFMETARFKEASQPYVAACHQGSTVASVHNGYIENYEKIGEELCNVHALESERIGLIDSEIIPHYFEQILEEEADVDKALSVLHETLQGSMATAMLQTGRKGAFLHLVHKGKTRGLTVWTNKNGEIVFCSRKETLTPTFENMLTDGRFKEKVAVRWREEKNIKLSFVLES
jgi:glucosamine 6-phosphate synthetase-like amidotransferase/phosphosugar isomerase protein